METASQMADAMQSLRVGAVYLALTLPPRQQETPAKVVRSVIAHRYETAKRMFYSSESLTSEEIMGFFSRWVLTHCQPHASAVSDKDRE